MKLESVLDELALNLGARNLDSIEDYVRFSSYRGSTVVSFDTELNGIYNRSFIIKRTNLAEDFGMTKSAMLDGLRNSKAWLNTNETGRFGSFSSDESILRSNASAEVSRIRSHRGTENDDSPPYWTVSLNAELTSPTEVKFNVTELNHPLQARYGEDYTGEFAVYGGGKLIGYVTLTGDRNSVDPITQCKIP